VILVKRPSYVYYGGNFHWLRRALFPLPSLLIGLPFGYPTNLTPVPCCNTLFRRTLLYPMTAENLVKLSACISSVASYFVPTSFRLYSFFSWSCFNSSNIPKNTAWLLQLRGSWSANAPSEDFTLFNLNFFKGFCETPYLPEGRFLALQLFFKKPLVRSRFRRAFFFQGMPTFRLFSLSSKLLRLNRFPVNDRSVPRVSTSEASLFGFAPVVETIFSVSIRQLANVYSKNDYHFRE
jgi:hypothetical protein